MVAAELELKSPSVPLFQTFSKGDFLGKALTLFEKEGEGEIF
jgi:hypothetical protein